MAIRRWSQTRTDPAEVDAHIEESWRLAQELDEALVILAALAVIGERAWTTGEEDPRLDRADVRLAASAALPGTEWAIGDVRVWMQRLGLPTGDHRTAAPHGLELAGRHDEAASAWRTFGLPFESTVAGVHSADASVALGAVAHLASLDVPATTARARRLLQERGVRVAFAGPRRTTRANPSGLTNRQLDVARLLARGYTSNEVARDLFISPRTADHHVAAILDKLGLSHRRDVVRIAEELGLT